MARSARDAKAKAVFPRPTAGALRPAVHSMTKRYNSKVRAGRGFTLEELKAAGIPAKYAPTVGICVDHRRKNHSEEGLAENVARLTAYKEKLVVFPRKTLKAGAKAKAGDASAADLAAAVQQTGPLMPLVKAKPVISSVVVTEEMKANKAYATLRRERMNSRMVGIRAKKAAEKKKVPRGTVTCLALRLTPLPGRGGSCEVKGLGGFGHTASGGKLGVRAKTGVRATSSRGALASPLEARQLGDASLQRQMRPRLGERDAEAW